MSIFGKKDDAINCIGISDLLSKDNLMTDLSLEDIEKEIISGVPAVAKNVDSAKMLSQQINNFDRMTKNSDGIDLASFVQPDIFENSAYNPSSHNSNYKPSSYSYSSSSSSSSSNQNQNTNKQVSFSFNQKESSPRNSSIYSGFSSSSFKPPQSSKTNVIDDDDDIITNNSNNDSDSDDDSIPVTTEQQKQEVIRKTFKNHFDKGGINSIVESAELDDVSMLLEKINELEQTLIDDDIDISKVPRVDKSSSPEMIRDVYKTLCLKNDRSRYAGIAEELFLSGASIMEDIFNGEREFFGRKPDLVGWSSTVKQKLKRMRHETSTFVHGIMNRYGLCSGGMRLFIELIPSMFMYSRKRRVTKNNNLSFSGTGANMNMQDALENINKTFK